MEKKQRTGCECDASKQIKGIVCDVRGCAYHSGTGNCCAGCITVGPSDAECSASTSCATFKPRECC